MSSLDKVAKHADALDKIAGDMQADGIGLHATRGHAMMLKSMASAMRADAANGKVPHEYSGIGYYASADVAPLPSLVLRTLTAAGIETDAKITVEDFDKQAQKAGLSIDARLQAKRALAATGRFAA